MVIKVLKGAQNKLMSKHEIKEFLKKHWWKLLISILIPEAVGFISSLLSGNVREVYTGFNRPPMSPPGWLFPVAWIILYALMGIAVYIVIAKSRSLREKLTAITIYGVQLALNFSWSIVFFRFTRLGAAAVILMVLVVCSAVMMSYFYRKSKLAGWLILPYLVWLVFALYLCVGVFILN